MSIRIAQLKDLEVLTEIYNQAIVRKKCTADTETFTTEERLPWFNAHQSELYPLYVYEVNGNIAGYLYFSAYRPGRKAMQYTAEISYYLHSDYQGQGIGSKFMEFGLEKGKELGFKTLVAILLAFNTPSIKLLKKYGFEEWGRLVDIAEFDGEVCSHLYYGLKI